MSTQLSLLGKDHYLSTYEFGRELILTEDLDPVYVILYRAKLQETQLMRLLLAYWMFYSLGTAARCVEDRCFYDNVDSAARNKDPRGTERRHFRGEACFKSIAWFKKNFPKPEDAVRSLKKYRSFLEVREAVMQWPLFGPWIAFKVADMLERVLGWPIDFSDCDLLSFYQEPKAGAEILAEKENTTPEAALAKLLKQFSRTQLHRARIASAAYRRLKPFCASGKAICTATTGLAKIGTRSKTV